MTGEQHQPGQATASQAWAAYLARQAETDAARQISTDLGTDEGLNAYLLQVQADAAYGDYEDAWWRENCNQPKVQDPALAHDWDSADSNTSQAHVEPGLEPEAG